MSRKPSYMKIISCLFELILINDLTPNIHKKDKTSKYSSLLCLEHYHHYLHYIHLLRHTKSYTYAYTFLSIQYTVYIQLKHRMHNCNAIP